MRKIRKGDKVQVISGKDKGRTGTVLKILVKPQQPATGEWIIVQGVNLVKEHVKPHPSKEDQPSGIVSREAPMPISKVALVDLTGKPSRVGFRTLADGKKVRYFKSSGEVVDV